MATFEDLLDDIAYIVGGTRPDSTNKPHFFSGATVGDGTGVSGVKGCYSVAPDTIQEPPLGIILPGPFTAGGMGSREILTQGEEYQVDNLRLLLLVRKNDNRTQWAVLNPFRDSVPAAFRAHMQLSGTPVALDASRTPLDVFIDSGKPGVTTWGGEQYLAWDFNLRVRRTILPNYTA